MSVLGLFTKVNGDFFYCPFVPFSPPIALSLYAVRFLGRRGLFWFGLVWSLNLYSLSRSLKTCHIFSYPWRVTFHYLSSKFMCWDEEKDEARKEDMSQMVKVLSYQASESDFYLKDNYLC